LKFVITSSDLEAAFAAGDPSSTDVTERAVLHAVLSLLGRREVCGTNPRNPRVTAPFMIS